MPNLVWVSFGALAVILTAAGAMLILDADIFPWDLRSEASVICAALAFHCLFVYEPTRLGSSRR